MSVSEIEVSQRALLANILTFRQLIAPKTKLLAVVKADAYGHGLELVAQAIKIQVDWFGVDNLDEARVLRATGIKKPILVLGYTSPREVKEAAGLDISLACYNLDVLPAAGTTAKLHLKIETGTNRQGISLTDLPQFTKKIKNLGSQIEGAYTHFANIEDTLDPSFAKYQLSLFKKAVAVLKKYGIKPKFAHTAATAATLLYPETHLDMVRIGIGLYGLWPSRETRIAVSGGGSEKVKLVPALTWKTKIVQVKKVRRGDSVGYGRSWWALRDSVIAVVPVGYADGYPRVLSNKGKMLVQGQPALVVGRVAMNMTTIDVTDIAKTGVGDEVVILGRQGKNEITAEWLAEQTGTINYEIVSRLNPLIPRKLVK